MVVGRLQQRAWTAEEGSAGSVVEVVGRGAGAKLAMGDGDGDQDDEEPGLGAVACGRIDPTASRTTDQPGGLPVTTSFTLTIDCADADQMMEFWTTALGRGVARRRQACEGG